MTYIMFPTFMLCTLNLAAIGHFQKNHSPELVYNLTQVAYIIYNMFYIQSRRSGPAKHGDAYFSAVYGFMKDPIAAPGLYENVRN